MPYSVHLLCGHFLIKYIIYASCPPVHLVVPRKTREKNVEKLKLE